MCTVTYIPLENDDFILTSNRDETPLRKTISPAIYEENGVKITYPKDAIAGGTWIGLSELKRTVCLLNGAFEKHKRQPNYKLSRGVIVKKLLTIQNYIQFWNEFYFTDIEPFTVVLVDYQATLEAFELVWDGTQKHQKKIEQKPQIWSSSPLYDAEMKVERHAWFDGFINQNKHLSQEKLLEFHQFEKIDNPENSIKMKRFLVETVSTTTIKKEKQSVDLQYIDYLNYSISTQKKEIIQLPHQK
ncbi:MAG: NRDE family protein [Polaribacter sp.]|nr:NRDE family protein [Polaribacter sp.]